MKTVTTTEVWMDRDVRGRRFKCHLGIGETVDDPDLAAWLVEKGLAEVQSEKKEA